MNESIEKLSDYLKQYHTLKTAKSYQREIENYLSNNPKAENYTYSQIINAIGKLRERYPNISTLSRIVASIKVYYSYLCFMEVRSDNPSKAILLRDLQNRAIQLQDLFTSQELEALLTAKKERYTKLDYRNKVLISLLIYQALKPQEMENINIEDINLTEGTIYIKPSPKSNGRELALKPKQIMLFYEYINQIRPKLLNQTTENKALLLGIRNESMTAEDITKHIKRNYKIYLQRKVNAKSIRQSVICNLLKQGHDLRVVQTFAGHKYPSTTEKYKQTNVEELKSALQKYHPFV
jgi:integrase/recombinase XerD